MACKKTSSSVASKASKLLKDGRTSKTTKSVAGSALSQRQPKHTQSRLIGVCLFKSYNSSFNYYF